MLEKGTLTPAYEQILQNIFNMSYIINHIIGAYAMFIATIVYCGFINRKMIQLLKVVLLIPPILTILISPIWPVIQINWVFLAAWAVPYIFIGTYFLYRAYSSELSKKIKNDKLIVLVAVGGPTMTVAFTNYLARCFGFDNLYTSNIIVIGILFVFIITVIFKNNFMGIRIKVEKDRIDSAMKAVVSGTSILNHTIKGEMVKIAFSADMCRKIGLDEQQTEYIDTITTSTDYLLEMTQRIEHHLHEVVIKPEETQISKLINQAIKMNETICRQKDISIKASITDEKLTSSVDPMHISEVLNNLVRNSVEAMREKGSEIILGLSEGKRMITITVSDNGPGISSADLPYVLDPFYSTKHRTKNFGLGLTHSYNIMKQHHGNLELSSVNGNGTTVKLNFTKSK